MLQPVEEALDEVASSIGRVIHGSMDEPAAEARNMCPCPGLADQVENSVAVIAAVGDDVASRRQIPQEFGHGALVVCLAGCKHDADGQAIFVHDRVDFRAQSPTRETDGVIRAPFLPPAACWWARMIELSISRSDCGECSAKASNTLSQIPALAQRLNRL